MDICLVTTPYASVERPLMGLGLLKGALEKTQLETTCLYPNLAFAERIGVENYNAFQFIKPEDLGGEWTFCEALFGPDRPEDDYLDWVIRRLSWPPTPRISRHHAEQRPAKKAGLSRRETMRGLPKPEKTAHFFTQSISSIPDVDIGHLGERF